MRRIRALVCTLLLAAAPVTALPLKSSADKQLEFGVEMALKGSWREAAFRFEKAVRIDPENPFAHNNLAVALESVGRFDEALEAYERARGLAPKNERIEENLRRLQAYMETRSQPGFISASNEADPPSTQESGPDRQPAPGAAGEEDDGS